MARNNFLHDTRIVTFHELLLRVRNPLWLFFGLFQPIVYLALFAPFLKGIAHAPGFPSSSAIQFFAPGLLIMNALFGAGFAGFGLIDKLRSGFIERLRVTPVSRIALVLGFVLGNAIQLIVQSALLLMAALFFGLQINWVGLLLLVILLLLIGCTMASISYSIALMVKDEGVLAATTNFFTLPLMLLSGIMLPIDFAPTLLQALAKIDPFAYAVTASRALMNGSLKDPSVAIAFTIFEVLTVLALAWFIKAMREAVA